MSKKESRVVYTKDNITLTELSTARGTRVSLDLGVDAVLVVAEDMEGNYILVKQFRETQNKFTYEFPSGGIKHDEEPKSAARRELGEELGAKVKTISKLRVIEPLSGIVNFKLHIFHAIIDSHFEEDRDTDEGEELKTVVMRHDVLRKKVKSGYLNDIYVILAIGVLAIHNE
jgi:8-oxo-dGTP pyrophosphatase MutT (NUDIX family)